MRWLLSLALLAVAALAHAQPPAIEVQEVAQTGSMPKGASLSPDGSHFFVTNFGQANGNNITMYDSTTLVKTATINVPGVVVESVLSPDGTLAYIDERNTGDVAVVAIGQGAAGADRQSRQHSAHRVVHAVGLERGAGGVDGGDGAERARVGQGEHLHPTLWRTFLRKPQWGPGKIGLTSLEETLHGRHPKA
jgi:hypothetical protein